MAIVQNIQHSVAAPGLGYKWLDEAPVAQAKGTILPNYGFGASTDALKRMGGAPVAQAKGTVLPNYGFGASTDALNRMGGAIVAQPTQGSGGNNIFSSAIEAVQKANDLGKNAADAANQVTVQSGGGNPTVPTQNADYMAQLSAMIRAQQDQQQAQLRAQQQEHQNLVEQAYQNNMNALLSSYGNQKGNLGSIYNDTMNQLESNYNYGAEKIRQDRENALREAYVNRMMAQRDLPQRLNAQGLTGGAAESAVASLLNNYGNARNNIETESMNDLANLLNLYQNNANSAGQKYAQALNDLESNNFDYQRRLENDLTNGVIGTYDNLYNALASGANTYANAMEGLAASQVGHAADLAAANYKNYLNAQNKATTSKKSSNSLSVTGGNSSVTANVATRLANGEDPGVLWTELIESGMDLSDAKKYLNSLGANI